jgi:hypothetical protein
MWSKIIYGIVIYTRLNFIMITTTHIVFKNTILEKYLFYFSVYVEFEKNIVQSL